jgi:archaellum biogenesis protein FlaJ (TadC family)
MRIEVIPLIAAAIVGLIGLGLIFDAWTPDEIIVKQERRRRRRIERNRTGEAAIGLGVLCMAAAFAGRDTWRYSVVAVIAGTVLVLFGVIKNYHYFGAVLSNRGSLRRRPPGAPVTPAVEQDKSPQAERRAPR